MVNTRQSNGETEVINDMPAENIKLDPETEAAPPVSNPFHLT